jgi:hypothetical protein
MNTPAVHEATGMRRKRRPAFVGAIAVLAAVPATTGLPTPRALRPNWSSPALIVNWQATRHGQSSIRGEGERRSIAT